MDSEYVKLSFLGDITCDRPLLNAARIKKGEYDFSTVFSKVKSVLDKSDYVVANFETVCAGSSNDFQSGYLLYNCPDQLVKDMKAAGVDFVTTANNHCLDQGIAGLVRTIDVLDNHLVEHSGTYKNIHDHQCFPIIDVDSVKIAILSYTYSTNESNTGVVLNSENDYYVNLLREPNDIKNNSKGLRHRIGGYLSAAQRRKINRCINRMKLCMGIPYFKVYVDRINERDTNNKYLVQMEQDIHEAKKRADIVVVCPHMGGQFNEEPGEYSKFLVNYLKEKNVDVIIGNHPHVVQRAFASDLCAAAYSVGSFNLSVSADYIVHDALPEYSIMVHVYVDKSAKRISRTAFSILKIVEDASHMITVYPVELLENMLPDGEKEKLHSEVTIIYNRVTGENLSNVVLKEEYELHDPIC